jgi:hypothetical protein
VARVILVGSTRLASSSWISVLSASNLWVTGIAVRDTLPFDGPSFGAAAIGTTF